jgi:hypothetical protein
VPEFSAIAKLTRRQAPGLPLAAVVRATQSAAEAEMPVTLIDSQP